MAETLRKLKIVIIVFAVLLGLNLAALGGIILYRQTEVSGSSAVAPDNYIEPAGGNGLCTGTYDFTISPVMLRTAFSPVPVFARTIVTSDRADETVLSIYRNHAEDSTPFQVPNMFPGDSETKAYLVEVSHRGTVTVRFHADIRDGYEKLAEVLKCKVVLREESKLLYDGLMRDMPESLNHRITSTFRKTTDLSYDITVYLDTSVGNEYMNKELVADFRWWVEESGGNTPDLPDDTDKPVETDETKQPEDTTKPEETTSPDETDKPDETDDTTKPDETDETTKPGETDETETTKPDETGSTEIDPAETDEIPGPDDGELTAPQTWDNAHFCVWFWIAVFSLIINIILLRPKRRGNHREQEGWDK